MNLSRYDGLSKYITLDCENCPFYLEVEYKTPRGKKRDIVCNWGKHLTLLVERDNPRKCGLKIEESPNRNGGGGLYRDREDVIDKLVKLEELDWRAWRRE